MAVADNLVVTTNQQKIFGSFILSDVDKSYPIGDLPHLYQVSNFFVSKASQGKVLSMYVTWSIMGTSFYHKALAF